MNMVSVSLRGGLSVMQTEVLFSNIVRILGSLLQLQTKCPSLQPHLSNLQLDISKKVSDTLEQEGDVEVRLSTSRPFKGTYVWLGGVLSLF